MVNQFKGKQEVPELKIPEKFLLNKEPNGSLKGKRAVRPSQISPSYPQMLRICSYCQIYHLNY